LRKELHGLAVEFLKGLRILEDIPIRPALEMLDDAHFHGFGLVISQLYFE